MKSRSLLRTGLAAVAVVALVASTASARPGPSGGGRGHDPSARLERHLERLGLDGATLEAAMAVIDASRAESRAARSRLQEARRELRGLLRQDTPDSDAVLAQAEVIGKLDTQARVQHLKTLLQVQALLTPEQREHLRESLHEHPRPGRCDERPPR